MPEDRDPLISISAAARKIGVDKSTLSKQVRLGSVRSHGGKVRLSEVLADRAANIDLTRSKRRQGRIDDMTASPRPEGMAPADDLPNMEEEDEDADGDHLPVLVDGKTLSYADARALKETYIAWLRQIEYDRESRKVVDAATAGKMVADEYAIVRSALLAIPSKVAPRAAVMKSAEQIKALIETEVFQALQGLTLDRDPGALGQV